MRKPAYSICENKDADQLRSSRYLISVFVFATRIIHYLYFLNAKCQASSHLLWLYSPVCVGPGRKPQDRFSHNEAHILLVPKFQVSLYDSIFLYIYTVQHVQAVAFKYV